MGIDKGVQTVVTRGSVVVGPRAAASQPLLDFPDDWMSRPHTVTVLGVALLLVAIGSYCHGKMAFDTRQNLIMGIAASVLFFLMFGTVQFPDGVLLRPSRHFWRLIKGGSVCYLCLLIFVLFQNLDDVRKGLGKIDPHRLGVPLEERDYAADCRIYTPEKGPRLRDKFSNIWESFDLFVFCHLAGWFVKAMVIRDAKLLWFNSLLFEWMEISLRHILPNFWECWWDNLLFDVFGCNLLGIACGLRLCKWFKMKEYSWRSREEGPCLRPFYIFTPYTWTEYRWPSFLRDAQTFLSLLGFSLSVTVLDLNYFFLKAELWIQPSHWINGVRITLFAAAAAAGTREFYVYMSNDEPHHKIGVQCWLNIAMITSETLMVIKFREGIPPHGPPPLWIKVTWTIIAIAIAVTTTWLLLTSPRRKYPPTLFQESQSTGFSDGCASLLEPTDYWAGHSSGNNSDLRSRRRRAF